MKLIGGSAFYTVGMLKKAEIYDILQEHHSYNRQQLALCRSLGMLLLSSEIILTDKKGTRSRRRFGRISEGFAIGYLRKCSCIEISRRNVVFGFSPYESLMPCVIFLPDKHHSYNRQRYLLCRSLGMMPEETLTSPSGGPEMVDSRRNPLLWIGSFVRVACVFA